MKGAINFDPSFMAGFTLAAYRKPDGTLESVSGAKMSGWPDEITIEGTTFTFEYESFVGQENDPNGHFMNAEYV